MGEALQTSSGKSTAAGLGAWFRAALISFGVAGVVEWAMAAGASTAAGMGGLVAGGLLFVALWVLGGAIWALISASALWLATGRVSVTPPLVGLLRRAKLWWRERHSDKDSPRLAGTLAAGVALAGFGAGSTAGIAHLIANRNGPVLIAIAALVGQAVLAVGLVVVALTVRRLLTLGLLWIREKWWPRWVHAPAVLVVAALAAVGAAAALLVANIETFQAIEGPSITLVAAAMTLHPLIASSITERWRPARLTRVALLAAPLLAVAVVGAASQQPDARRLLVLHGESTHFAFNSLQRHVPLDRVFQQKDCPPLGPDGLPTDGASNEEYEAQCLDPALDRPVARTDIPPVERPELEQRPSVLFITWDSVRADRLGYMGHERDTTPNLDKFAAKSLVFERAFAQDSGTAPSFWSLTAGKTPFQVALTRANHFPPTIEPSEKMLGELFEEAGYQTQAVMCGRVFDRKSWGIRRGFQKWKNVCGKKKRRLAPIVKKASIEALDQLSETGEPFFLWVHFYDVHHPYTDHKDIDYGSSRTDRYDEELRYADRHMQGLLEAAEALGEQRPLYTIFGADHGENFKEHGSDPHARNLYRIVTQVPKIIHGPGVEPRRVEAPVALNDVYPTVLDLAGIPIPDETTMVSQVPVLFGAPPDEERMVFQENSYSRPRRHTRALVWGRYHYIMDLTTNSNEFYDYVDDPIERTNLIGHGLIEERIMRQALVRFLRTSHIPEGLRE